MLKNIPKKKGMPIEGFLIFLCILFLPLKPIWSNIPLIIFILVVFLKYYQNITKVTLKSIGLLFFFLLFLLHFVGLFFTSEFSSEVKVVEKVISFLVVPFSFALLPKEKLPEVTTAFWEGIFILGVFLGLFSFLSAVQVYGEIGEIPVNGPRVNDITHLHRPYFAFIEVLSVVYILSLIYDHGFKISFFRYIGLVVSIASLNLVVARLAIAALAIVVLYFLFMYLYRQKILNYKTVLVTALVFISSLTLLLNNPRFTDRFKYLVQGKGEARILIWRCAYDQLFDENFSLLFGNTSSTTTQDKLTLCYKNEFDQSTYWSWVYGSNNYFNTHNEYFNLLLSYGVVGLSIFILLLIFLFKKSLKYKYFAGQLFIIVFAINCITENMLARQVSIFIFSICASTIIFHHKRS